MLALLLLIIYCGVVAVGLLLCAAAFLADPSLRTGAEIIALAVPLVLLWPWILIGHIILGILKLVGAVAMRVSAR